MKMHSPMGNKGPLDDFHFAKLSAELQRFADRKAARQKRYVGLRSHRLPRRGRVMFDHLPPDIRQKAEQKFEAYKLKHAAKLASLSGLAKVRFLGSLAGAASAHAKLSGFIGDNSRSRIMSNRAKILRSRLGLRTPKPSWGRGPVEHRGKRLHEILEQQVMAEHANNGQPTAIAGSTDLTGI